MGRDVNCTEASIPANESKLNSYLVTYYFYRVVGINAPDEDTAEAIATKMWDNPEKRRRIHDAAEIEDIFVLEL